jgi:hypothetical protein
MIRMGFCTGPLLATDIETEIFSATMAEFKEVLIQDRTADFTVMELHFSPKTRSQGFEGSRVQVASAFTADEILFNSPPVNGGATDLLDPLNPRPLEPF